MTHLWLILSPAMWVAGLTWNGSPPPQAPPALQKKLTDEKAKLKRQTGISDRAKTYVRILDILLDMSADSAGGARLEEMNAQLDEYVATAEETRKTLLAHPDTTKRPRNIKELEIGLRRQLRQLDDIGKLLTFEERAPVTKAIEVATAVRGEVLKLLFGDQNASP